MPRRRAEWNLAKAASFLEAVSGSGHHLLSSFRPSPPSFLSGSLAPPQFSARPPPRLRGGLRTRPAPPPLLWAGRASQPRAARATSAAYPACPAGQARPPPGSITPGHGAAAPRVPQGKPPGPSPPRAPRLPQRPPTPSPPALRGWLPLPSPSPRVVRPSPTSARP